jgi:hypothetical protein
MKTNAIWALLKTPVSFLRKQESLEDKVLNRGLRVKPAMTN